MLRTTFAGKPVAEPEPRSRFEDEARSPVRRKSRRRHGPTVTVYTSYLDPASGDELDVEVEVEVIHGGTPARGWDPGESPEVEFISAVTSEGVDVLSALEADKQWSEDVEREALESASEYDGPDTIEEWRGER